MATLKKLIQDYNNEIHEAGWHWSASQSMPMQSDRTWYKNMGDIHKKRAEALLDQIAELSGTRPQITHGNLTYTVTSSKGDWSGVTSPELYHKYENLRIYLELEDGNLHEVTLSDVSKWH